jgi:hypothetical protein
MFHDGSIPEMADMPLSILPYVSGYGATPESYGYLSALDWYEYAEREGLIPTQFEGQPIYLITALGKIERYTTIPEAHAARARCRQGCSEHADIFLDVVDLAHYRTSVYHAWLRLKGGERTSLRFAPDDEVMAASVFAHVDDLIKGGDHHIVRIKRLRTPKPPVKEDWSALWDRVTYLRLCVFTWQTRDFKRIYPNDPAIAPRTARYHSGTASKAAPAPKAKAPPVSTVMKPRAASHYGGQYRMYRTEVGKTARRGASRRTDTWNLIKDGMTLGELLSAGGHLDDFKKIQSLGHLEVR